MRRLRLSVACTLDGYISGRDGAIDWIRMDADYGMQAFFDSVDTALIGRRTYDFARQTGTPFFSGMTNYVFSFSIPPGRDEEVEIVRQDAFGFTRALKQQPGKDIWIMGGHTLTAALLSAQLVDEIRLTIHPILLGDGIPLFPRLRLRQQLVLREAKPHANGVVQTTYDVVLS